MGQGLFYQQATLYNRYFQDGEERYQATVLDGVAWQQQQLRKVVAGQVQMETKARVFIPLGVSTGSIYTKPKEWKLKSSVQGFWTLAPGDRLVLGAMDYQVLQSITELAERFDDVLFINSISYHSYAGSLAHWLIS